MDSVFFDLGPATIYTACHGVDNPARQQAVADEKEGQQHEDGTDRGDGDLESHSLGTYRASVTQVGSHGGGGCGFLFEGGKVHDGVSVTVSEREALGLRTLASPPVSRRNAHDTRLNTTWPNP
jgi:hypothetical protein